MALPDQNHACASRARSDAFCAQPLRRCVGDTAQLTQSYPKSHPLLLARSRPGQVEGAVEAVEL